MYYFYDVLDSVILCTYWFTWPILRREIDPTPSNLSNLSPSPWMAQKRPLHIFFATRYHIQSKDGQSKACPMCNGLITTRNTIGSFNMNNVANFSNSPDKNNHEDHTTELISPNSVVASTSAGNMSRRYINSTSLSKPR